MYKAFALMTLIGAPLVVFVAQSFLPGPTAPAAQVTSQKGAGSAAISIPQAPPRQVPDMPPPVAADFSQPLPGAATPALTPALAPGLGLPDNRPPFRPNDAPAPQDPTRPGSPDQQF